MTLEFARGGMQYLLKRRPDLAGYLCPDWKGEPEVHHLQIDDDRNEVLVAFPEAALVGFNRFEASERRHAVRLTYWRCSGWAYIDELLEVSERHSKALLDAWRFRYHNNGPARFVYLLAIPDAFKPFTLTEEEQRLLPLAAADTVWGTSENDVLTSALVEMYMGCGVSERTVWVLRELIKILPPGK